MGIFNISDWRVGSPTNRGFSITTLAGGFQPINIDSLDGLTIHYAANVGLTHSAGVVREIINTARPGFRMSGTTALLSPITSSVFSSVTPFVPFFSRSTGQAKYVYDADAAGVRSRVSGVISFDQYHCFAVLSLNSTGAAMTIQGPGLGGAQSRDWIIATIEPTGSRVSMSGTTTNGIRFSNYNTVVMKTNTKYVVESAFGSYAPLSTSLMINGGFPCTGNMTPQDASLQSTEFIYGSENTIIANASDAHIAEFVMFSRSLDSTTALNVRKTLGLKWGINVEPPELSAIDGISNISKFQGPAGTGSLGGPDFGATPQGSFGIIARKITPESLGMVREYRFARFLTAVSGYRTMIYDNVANNRTQIQLVNGVATNVAEVNVNFLQNSKLYSFGFVCSGSAGNANLSTYLTGALSSAPTALVGYTEATAPFTIEAGGLTNEFEVVSVSFSPLGLSDAEMAAWSNTAYSGTLESGDASTARRLRGATYHWEASDWPGGLSDWVDQISGLRLAASGTTLVKRNIRGSEWAM